jgi:hypothetical protein
MRGMNLTRTQQAIQTPFDNSTNGFVATDTQTAIEEAKLTGGVQRFTISLLHNSSLTNGQRMGFSEVLPNTPVILPKNAQLKELTFSNNSTVADARFDIYRRPTPLATNVPGGTATLLQQWTITNSLTAILTGMSHAFTAGQELLIVFVDTGDNPSDVSMICFFQAT